MLLGLHIIFFKKKLKIVKKIVLLSKIEERKRTKGWIGKAGFKKCSPDVKRGENRARGFRSKT